MPINSASSSSNPPDASILAEAITTLYSCIYPNGPIYDEAERLANTESISKALEAISNYSHDLESIEKTSFIIASIQIKEDSPLFEKFEACIHKIKQIKMDLLGLKKDITQQNIYCGLKDYIENNNTERILECLAFIKALFNIDVFYYKNCNSICISLKKQIDCKKLIAEFKKNGIPFFIYLSNRHTEFPLDNMKSFASEFGSAIKSLSLKIQNSSEHSEATETIRLCTNLQSLLIYDNTMQKFPESLTSPSLKSLTIESLSLAEMPDLSKFPQLEELELNAYKIGTDLCESLIKELSENRPLLAFNFLLKLYEHQPKKRITFLREIEPQNIIQHAEIVSKIVLLPYIICSKPFFAPIPNKELQLLFKTLYLLNAQVFENELLEVKDKLIERYPADWTDFFTTLGFFHYVISQEQVLQRIIDEPELPLEDLPEVKIKELLYCFDCLNFEKSGEPLHVAPEHLSDGSRTFNPKQVRKGLSTIIASIKTQSPFMMVPTDPEKRKTWYANLEKVFKNIVHFIETQTEDHPENATPITKHLVKLGIAGDYCGTRWKTQANTSLRSLLGVPIPTITGDNVEGILLKWCQRYLKEKLVEYAASLPFCVGNHLHTYGYIVKVLMEQGYHFSKKITEEIDFEDSSFESYAQVEGFDPATIRSEFHNALCAGDLIKSVQFQIHKLQNKSSDRAADFVDCLCAYAEEHLIEDETKIGLRRLSKEMKFDKLKQTVIDHELLLEDYNEETMEVNRSVTQKGAFVLLKQFGLIENITEATPLAPVFSS